MLLLECCALLCTPSSPCYPLHADALARTLRFILYTLLSTLCFQRFAVNALFMLMLSLGLRFILYALLCFTINCFTLCALLSPMPML
jgi:hypothetical protein